MVEWLFLPFNVQELSFRNLFFLGSYHHLTMQVERVAIKRKHEEVKQCGPVVLETEHHEDNASDDSASSSDSDASDSESEQWKRRGISSKRRRGGEDASGKSPWSDESRELSSGGRMEPILPAQGSDGMQDEEEAAEYDDELEEMQELLELQLQVTSSLCLSFDLCFFL